LKDGGIGALVGLAIIPCILIILCLLGFTCVGVAAGSFVAFRQAQIGMIPAKSLFSLCQSFAMSPGTLRIIPFLGIAGFFVGIIYHFL
jgi:hypothetical protein